MSFSVLVSSGYMPWSWIAGSYGGFIKESPYHLPKMLYQFAFPQRVQQGSLFYRPSPVFTVCRLFDDGPLDWCEVIAHCFFDFHFFNNE